MPLVVPDVGEVVILQCLHDGVHWFGWEVRLYQNNLTPDEDTVFGDIADATFSGYSAQTVNLDDPTIVGHKGKSVGVAPLDFIHNGGGTANTIYGYWVKMIGLSELVYVERFASPIVMTNNGDKISITLALTANSEN